MAAESLSLDVVRAQIRKLSTADKIALAEELWDEIPFEESEVELSTPTKTLLEERIARWEANPVGGITLEEWEKKHFGDE